MAIIALCAALALVACGDDSSNDSAKSDTASTESAAEKAPLTKPKVEVPKGPPPKKLVTEDLEEGEGPAAKAGDEVAVQYVLVEYKNGKEIEASWDRGEPFSFQLGSGSVIPGWEQGVTGMKVGGRRELIVPSNLAYGSGALVFVIDLLSIGGSTDAGQPSSDSADGKSDKPTVEVPDEPPPEQLVVEDLKEGSGAEVKAGDKIVVNYVGVNYKTGKEFEAVWDPEEPTTFQLGTGEVIKGWEQGLKGMKAGGRRELTIPSNLAFKTGVVIYVVDLLDVK